MDQPTDQTTQSAPRQRFFDAPPKFLFAFGLLGGLAVLSTVGLIIAVSLLLSDGTNAKATASANTNGTVAGATAPTPTPTPTTAGNPAPAEPTGDITKTRPVSDADHVRGKADAKVTLLEYSDFECPYCRQFYPVLKQVFDAYPDDVRLVYRHFPLSFHPNAQKAAEASECAADQGKFWEFHDELFAATLSPDVFGQIADKISLDRKKFDSCLSSGEKASIVQTDYNEGATAGVTGTPATFVNDFLVSGATSFTNLKTQIDALL